ncbi:MAG: DNA methyltransferase [Pigmentiphaga sp.]|uniref:site-specific DNA-methyltransferase n=1 Tax=Pigmentiphaga sp. TaxID=1977564 RepID=UPI0029AA3C6E|nr:DNA methyltransferase [Pigmentiphaga sp.]MDX3907701.1 DNA methyltransferase [Pigmentiphaga sp.]
MTNKHNPKFQELVVKLREIFQIDRPELDFGIYRILNARAGEINDYLENRLAEKVQAALSSGNEAQREQVARELKEKEVQYQADGIDPGTVPKVKELREKLAQYTAGASEHENAVFSHLLTFFSRYYQDGDFISQRRYKGDTYAIPYAGEEVMLHWANKDQYYTKSGENFSNYSFKLEDGRTVHFRLVAADTAKDNRKDNDKERRFALVEKKTVTRIDDQGDEYEEDILPVEEVDGANGKELIVRFDYAAQPKGTKQEALVTKAVETVLADAAVKARWLALGNRVPTEKNPQRTLLEKQLTDYTTKNTADYFIHKDLGGFLRRELDFYIKNEVMRLDDVQNAGAFADIEKNLRMIQCLRAIALDLIAFLAQLEEFQKKLWLKKKFVVSSHYCITLDRVPEALWPEIVANERQWTQWKALGVWSKNAPGTMEDLKAGLYRMVDTSLYDIGFKRAIQAAIDDIDGNVDGLILQSDNFQALNLLSRQYNGSIQSIYIDPPYNTDAGPIIYKNEYRSSSWASLIYSRVEASKGLLTPDGVLCATIDDYQVNELAYVLLQIFGSEHKLGTSVIRNNPSGRSTVSGLSVCHEYAFYFRAGESGGLHRLPRSEKQLERFTEENGVYVDWRNFRKDGGAVTHRAARPKQYYPVYVKVASKSLRIPNLEWNKDAKSWVALEEPASDEVVLYPVDDKGRDRVWSLNHTSAIEKISDLEVRSDKDGGVQVYRRHAPSDGVLPRSWWDKNTYAAREYGSATLTALFGETGTFSFAKSPYAVQDCIWVSGMAQNDAVVLDYFAGSGTTAHAAISLNRQDEGSRKYILVEQGDYVWSVTVPRIQKVVYSSEWKEGNPTAPESGISHCFKILKLESYEDTLNNLQLRRTDAQGDLLNSLPQHAKDDYLLHYMLDVESRGSLLSVDDFRKPFDYTLNIAVDSAGAFEPRKVDLVETFNYLIGLCVKHIDAQPERGFVTITGTLPSGESCLVLWRDCDVLDYEGVSKLCDKLAINPADNEFDVVYINGDHNIPTVLTQTAEEGGATRVLKLRQIEPEFLERMFSVEDV